MATSGSIDFSMTAREVISFALRKLNVTASTEEPGADDAARAMTELNMMLKGWQKHENLWRMTEGSVTLVASTASYALSPVPHKVISARYRNSSSSDLPMNEMTREEYYNLPLKTSTGVPTNYFVDYQRSAVTIYTWPVISSVTTETIKYTYLRKFEDIDDLSNDIDVKTEHLEVVGYNLARRLGPDFGAAGTQKYAFIASEAERLLSDALDDDREGFVQFIAERY